MKKTFLLFFILLSFRIGAQVQVPPLFWGQGYWFTNFNPSSGPVVGLSSAWTDVKASGTKLMRVGGSNYNNATPNSSPATSYPQGYVDMVDDIRANGCEPMITVPYDGVAINISAQAAHAAEIVRVLNKVHRRNVKYFVIANEPGDNYGAPAFDPTTSSSTAQTYATNVVTYFKAFSIAMKQVDPDIIIVGPEMESFWDGVVIDYLLSNSSNAWSIRGAISSSDDPTGVAVGKYFLDIFSFHIYPQSISSAAGVQSYPETSFAVGKIDIIQGWINSGTRTPARNSDTDLKIALTEFNISANVYNSDTYISAANLDASTFVNGYKNQDTFTAGQWLAEMLAVGIREKLAFMNFWSVKEGDDLGYIHNDSDEKKSTYLHYKLLADHFKGSLYGSSTSLPTGIKSFACKNANSVAVLLMNETGSPVTFSLDLNSTNSSGGTADANFLTGVAHQETGTIGAHTTEMYVFNCSGTKTDLHVISQAALITTAGGTVPNTFAIASTNYTTTPTSLSTTPNVYCQSSTAGGTVSASGASSYIWFSPNAVIYTGATVNGLTVPGPYTVSSTGTCGTEQAVDVLSLQAPVVDAGPDQNLCSSSSVSIGNAGLPLSSGVPVYSWASSPSVSVSGKNPSITTGTISTTTTFTMTVTDPLGCFATDNVIVIRGTTPEVYIGDSPEDVGNEPNAESDAVLAGHFYRSNDIWNRVAADAGIAHQNPETSSSTNTLYVRIHNRSCATVTGDVELYYAKASSGLTWSGNWITSVCCATPYCGDQVPDGTPGFSVGPAGTTTHAIGWTPPDPSDYSCFMESAVDLAHFCLLGRLDVTSDAVVANSTDVGYNSHHDNNIAWKNVDIIDNDGFWKPWSATIIQNNSPGKFIRLNLESLKDVNGKRITDYAKVRVWFTNQLMTSWEDGGKRGEGVLVVNDTVIEITGNNAYMDNIFMQQGETQGFALQIMPFQQPPSDSEPFAFNVSQYTSPMSGGADPLGGQRFEIMKGAWTLHNCPLAQDTISGNVGGVFTYANDTIYISGNVFVNNRDTLTFQNAVVLVNSGANIKVSKGGQLNVLESEILPACYGGSWKGIDIAADSATRDQLTVTDSYIAGADTAVSQSEGGYLDITGSAFVSAQGKIGLYLVKSKDYNISGNSINGYDMCIKTRNTRTAYFNSYIRKNIFSDADTVMYLDGMNDKLDIQCNSLNYSLAGIYSSCTVLKDQGDPSYGTGNRYNSSSTQTYHMLRHTGGGSPRYYYDPAISTPAMNVNIFAAGRNKVCYEYSFDTTSGDHRPVMFQQASPEQTEFGITPVPNPTTGLTAVYFSLGTYGSADIIFSDIYGKVISTHAVNSSMEKLELDLGMYENGIYLLTLRTRSGERSTKKLIISK